MKPELDSIASFADLQGLAALRRRAARGEEGSLQEAARQFEALLLGQMLRQMREAQKVEGGLFDSPALDQYQQMMDQQLAQDLARRGGIGLARFIARQLSEPPAPQSPSGPTPAQTVTAAAAKPPWQPGDPTSFVESLLPVVRPVAERTGLAPSAIIAQAALETGWGRHVPRLPDGRSSFNLFGIKAGPGWGGERVRLPTLEYRDGLARREVAEFRAYPSLQAALDDYATLLSGSPRYAEALRAGGGRAWAEALQRAGYATDPRYAERLVAILGRPELQGLDSTTAQEQAS